jgi:hypothetical protein
MTKIEFTFKARKVGGDYIVRQYTETVEGESYQSGVLALHKDYEMIDIISWRPAPPTWSKKPQSIAELNDASPGNKTAIYPACTIHLRASELRERDIVRLIVSNPIAHSFIDHVVIKVDAEKKTVKLFRPYATTSEFSSTSGVIPYIGIEEYEIPLDSNQEKFVLICREPEAK